MPEMTYLESVLDLSSLRSARFSWGGRDYRGATGLDEERAVDLCALELEPESYGRELYDAVFPPGSELREGLREAVLAAEREKSRLRFLLHLSPELPEWVHALYWELLADQSRHLALARSPDTAFSRYLSVRRQPGAPTTRRPRLLYAVAAPADLARFGLAAIDRDVIVQRLAEPFSVLADAVEITLLEPPVTLERLRQRLTTDGGFHLLHFFGHGDRRSGVSSLVLEDEQGRAKFVGEEILAELFLGLRELRLVTLVACHGGAPSSHDPFSGLAGRLVQRGVPAVIAMRRAVSVETGHLFTDHLYRQIAHTGRADAAVNEARQQLYLADPQGIAWSSPVLYSRLVDGRLWVPQTEPPPAGESVAGRPLVRFAPRRLLRPLPWVPALAALALFGLGRWPAAEAEAAFDLRVSQLSFRLAKAAVVLESLELAELAATRLAALRLPSLLPESPPPSPGPAGGMTGILVAAGAGARLTLNAQPLPAGTEVVFEHQDGALYRLSLAGSGRELEATFQGDVLVKPLHAAPARLRLEQPESLALSPQGGVAELDLTFSRFTPDALSPDIPIDRLSLRRIGEQHTLGTTLVREESTVLGGTVSVRRTGRIHTLEKSEWLRYAALDGSLAGLRLAEDGVRLEFQGRVSGLERAAEGFEPESLMPSVLDLWITGPLQAAVQRGAAVLAVLILFFMLIERRTNVPITAVSADPSDAVPRGAGAGGGREEYL
ncbi:MAG TPA: CHAT domain-containing protein [Thermoanaerobaculia bacterium]|nr:CHAT domain-containing protein [Thermoanaerobaculia bacterium]